MTDDAPSQNFQKGKDLYEKFKMKANKKYLYKLLEEAAMTSTTPAPDTTTAVDTTTEQGRMITFRIALLLQGVL